MPVKVTGLKDIQEDMHKLESAVNKQIVRRVLAFMEDTIIERTAQGKFLNGSNFDYSKKGGLFRMNSKLRSYYRKNVLKGAKAGGKAKGESTARFIFLERGYYQYRLITKGPASVLKVVLRYSGRMLSNMKTIDVKDYKGSIGFTSKQQERKAKWLSRDGAGKNRVIYKFFGISPQEEELAAQEYERETIKYLESIGVELD